MWSSNIIYNHSNYRDYYQEQNITAINLSLKYLGSPFFKKIKLGFNSADGLGTQKFIYYNFKFSAEHNLFNYLKVLWNYDYQMKWINNSEAEGMYKDSIFRMKLIFSI